jgi:hypothetical protein
MSEHAALRNKRFKEAIEAFSHSPRFSLFKGAQIARLMPEGCEDIQGIGDMTVEELLATVQEQGGLPESIAPEHAEALSHLLVVLGEDGESIQAVPDDNIQALTPDSFSSVDIPSLDQHLADEDNLGEREPPGDVPIGSVPLELALRAALAKIVTHNRYPELRTRTLGEFWDPEWVGAPFEEAMTIEQFAGLDLAVLFKKRMVTDTRIQSILRALHRAQSYLERQNLEDHKQGRSEPLGESAMNAVAGHEVARTLKPSAVAQISELQGQQFQARQLRPSQLMALSPAALAVVEALRSGCERHPLAHAMLERFSLHQCVSIISGAKVSSVLLRELKQIVEHTVALQAQELILALLRAPAVRIAYIAQVLSGYDGELTARSLCIAAAVARGLGAVPIKRGESAGEEFWSMDPELVSKLLKGVSQAAKQRKQKMTIIISASAPLIDPALIDHYAHGHEKVTRAIKQGRKRASKKRAKRP